MKYCKFTVTTYFISMQRSISGYVGSFLSTAQVWEERNPRHIVFRCVAEGEHREYSIVELCQVKKIAHILKLFFYTVLICVAFISVVYCTSAIWQSSIITNLIHVKLVVYVHSVKHLLILFYGGFKVVISGLVSSRGNCIIAVQSIDHFLLCLNRFYCL